MRLLLVAATLTAAMPAPLYAQATGYAATIGGFFDDAAYTVALAPDNGTVLGGYTRSYGAGDRDFLIVKLDAAGLPLWQYTYGGTGDEDIQSIKATSDGGLIVAGYTTTFGAGQYDMWIVKLSSTGAIQWQKTYGGPLTEYAKSIEQTPDGGYIVVGYTASFGAGAHDIWLLRLNADGSVRWQKTCGGPGLENTYAVRQASASGFIVAGQANNFNLLPSSGNQDVWLLKLGESGNIEWQKSYGGPGIESVYTVENTAEGGYIFAAYSDSFNAGDLDVWIVKLNADGLILWQKAEGGSGDDQAFSISRMPDNGYVAAGDTNSFGAGGLDAWVFKINAQGEVLWQKTFGGGLDDSAHAYSSAVYADGGIAIAGQTSSFGAGGSDLWVIRLSKDGTLPVSSRPYILGVDTNAYVRDTFTTAMDTFMSSQDTFIVPQDTHVAPAYAPTVFMRQWP
ncbi:MAG: hypothetical protein HQL01_03085 [Nitrospirae bacterium]|nr:hypothetical protein [Nitrospirota bacterium]